MSDEEVIHTEEQSKLHHVKYQVEGSDEWLTIATTRPETILADTAICLGRTRKTLSESLQFILFFWFCGSSFPILTEHHAPLEDRPEETYSQNTSSSLSFLKT